MLKKKEKRYSLRPIMEKNFFCWYKKISFVSKLIDFSRTSLNRSGIP